MCGCTGSKKTPLQRYDDWQEKNPGGEVLYTANDYAVRGRVPRSVAPCPFCGRIINFAAENCSCWRERGEQHMSSTETRTLIEQIYEYNQSVRATGKPVIWYSQLDTE